MKAKVQGRFPFLGVMRVPGDILTDEEIARTSPQVRDALVSQKLIVLDGSDGNADASLVEEVKALKVTVEGLVETVQALLAQQQRPASRPRAKKVG